MLNAKGNGLNARFCFFKMAMFDVRTGKIKRQTKKKKGNKSQIRKLSSEKIEGIIISIQKIAEPLCDAENVKLVKVDCLQNTYDTIIRIYIDKPGGVTIDDCSNVSMQLGDILDVELNLNMQYRLEVSSPGI